MTPHAGTFESLEGHLADDRSDDAQKNDAEALKAYDTYVKNWKEKAGMNFITDEINESEIGKYHDPKNGISHFMSEDGELVVIKNDSPMYNTMFDEVLKHENFKEIGRGKKNVTFSRIQEGRGENGIPL